MSEKKNTSALKTVAEILTQLQSLGEGALEQLLRRMNYVGLVLKSSRLPDEATFKKLINNPPPQVWPYSKSKYPTYWLNPNAYLDDMVNREITMWQQFNINLDQWDLDCYRNYLERIGYVTMCYLRSWGYDVCIFPKLRVALDAPYWEYQEILPLDLDFVHNLGDKWHDVARDGQKCIYLREYAKICIVETNAIPETCEMPLNDLLKEAYRGSESEYYFRPDGDMIQPKHVSKHIGNQLESALRCQGVDSYHSRFESYLEATILDNYLADWPRVQRKASNTPVWLYGCVENVSQMALISGKPADEFGLHGKTSDEHGVHYGTRIERAYARFILEEDFCRYQNENEALDDLESQETLEAN